MENPDLQPVRFSTVSPPLTLELSFLSLGNSRKKGKNKSHAVHMKCVNLSPACSRSKCECDETRENLIETMSNLLRRSRAYHKGMQHEMYDDGENKTEIEIDTNRIVSLEECDRIEKWIIHDMDPMKLEIEQEIKKEIEAKKRYNMKKKLLKGNAIFRVGWATVSCPKEYDPATMVKNTNRLLKSKQFADSMCVLEFTGKEKQYHPHLHLLFSEKQLKNKNLRDIGRIFNVNHKNPHFIDYKTLTARDAIDEKIQYIKGEKQDDKHEQIANDKIIRTDNDIPEFFSQGNIYNG